MTIYIPNINFNSIERRDLFIATRPFFLGTSWGNDVALKKSWGIDPLDVYTPNIDEAQVMFLPKPVNDYDKKELQKINELCTVQRILCFGFISGDCATIFPFYERLIYFRAGGFKTQLPKNNIGLPLALTDVYKSLFANKVFELRTKQELPTVGFCGHASSNRKKRWRDKLSFAKKNSVRFFANPLSANYEPLFSSAFERFKLLKILELCSDIQTNFVYRNDYRAGAKTKQTRKQTSKEYFENIQQSDYVLCVRGSGNFSVRLYETLMMGRIPVFIDTNCLLPFMDDIDWKKHVVWVPWEKRTKIARIVSNFHNNLSSEEFNKMQGSNRLLWENTLSIVGIFQYIRKKTMAV